ncbi:hypothetical protein [Paenibacillus taichungensis]|uniref:hypothetical protein n=1 Tax=Paenibacillus taichungensis TaxID=484184 RepID=UPI001C2FDC6D|nr:hypothetical protein [Paenibacillus taichungensis]
MFQGSVNEAGQPMLTLNGADLSNSVVGRATGTSQMPGMAIVQTTVVIQYSPQSVIPLVITQLA